MRQESRNRFHAVRKSKVPREIVAQIRDMIASGYLKAGDRLPPERDLAQSFGVGRCALREAVRVLESLGLVDVRSGEGTFLRESDAARTYGHPSLEVLSTWSTQRNLFELRGLLEPGLAGLAARRATADHLMKMRRTIEAQGAKVERGESGMDEDVTFHRMIAGATENPALVQLMKDLTKALQETGDRSLQHDGRPARSLRQNRAILAAIESRNPALAARRMQAHIRSLARPLLAIDVQPAAPLRPIQTGENGPHSQRVVPSLPLLPMPKRQARTAFDRQPA